MQTLGLSQSQIQRRPASKNLIAADFKNLQDWIKDDEPINRPHLDAFGRWPIAQRITSWITSSSSTKPTLAIIGGLGSGKSSIFNLTVYQLLQPGHAESRVKLIRISLWPFDTTEAAIRGILSAITEELSYHINTSPISGLTDEYVDTIEAAGGGWARLLKNSRHPSAVLNEYNTVARAIGLHIVLWIEDLERFAGSPSPSEEPEVERLGPIRSLLHLLSGLSSLQVVLASSSLSTRFDIEKLARFVEAIPPIDPEATIRILHCFREGCLKEARGVIDPVSPEARKWLTLPEDSAEHSSWFILDSAPTLQQALINLCNNPRRLKYSLRTCLDAWHRLQGEIDFDDILAISVLRAAEPDVFSLINSHIDDLRSSARSSRSSEESEPSLFTIELEGLIGKEASERRESIECVLDFVFPRWSGRDTPSPYNNQGKPQGLSIRSHRDYWNRYLSMASVEPSDRDQTILGAIESWKSNTSEELVRMLVSGEQASATEAFIGIRLDSTRLVSLLEQVVLSELSRSTKQWGRDPRSVVVIWRSMLQKRPDEIELLEKLKHLLSQVVGTNLPLAHVLIKLFALHDTQTVPHLLSKSKIDDLNQYFRDLLASKFSTGGADQLLKAVNGGPDFTLYWCSWGLDRIRSNKTTGTPFEGWSSVSSTILEAAAKAPATMLPLILPFVIEKTDGVFLQDDQYHSVPQYKFSEEKSRRLFDHEMLMKIIKNCPALENPDEETLLSYQAAFKAATAISAT